MKRICSIIALSLFFSSLFGQSQKLNAIQSGIRIGVNLPSLSKIGYTNGSQEVSRHNLPNLSAGVFLIKNISNNASIQIEPSVNLFSFNEQYVDPYWGDEVSSKNTAMYLSLPILGSFNIINENTSIQIGPQIQYLINNKIKDNGYYNYYGPYFSNNFNIAISAGIQIKLKSLYLNGRYYYGLSKVDSDQFGLKTSINLVRFKYRLDIFYQNLNQNTPHLQKQ